MSTGPRVLLQIIRGDQRGLAGDAGNSEASQRRHARIEHSQHGR